MNKERFEGELLAGHKGTAIEVPFDPEGRWAIPSDKLWQGRRGHRVRGSLNGVPFDSFVVARARRFFVLVDEGIQQAAGLSVGDVVKVVIEPQAAGQTSSTKSVSRSK